MGRMKKIHKVIKVWDLTLNYICPVTNEKVTKSISEWDFESWSDECHGSGEISIDMSNTCNRICPSCGKLHDNIEVKSW